MTAIVKDSSAPLVVVVGATGIQGGSVVRVLAASDKPYRIRGLMHDASKPAAQELAKLDVDVHAVNLVVENALAVKVVFKGTDIASVRHFLHCFASHYPIAARHQLLGARLDAEGMSHSTVCPALVFTLALQEIDEGKLLIDTAHEGGPKRILWYGLESFSDATSGRLSLVDHFEGKAVVTKYARSKFDGSDIAFVLVPAGMYMTNLFTIPAIPTGDGKYAIALACKKDAKLPWIDMSQTTASLFGSESKANSMPRGRDLHFWQGA